TTWVPLYATSTRVSASAAKALSTPVVSVLAVDDAVVPNRLAMSSWKTNAAPPAAARRSRRRVVRRFIAALPFAACGLASGGWGQALGPTRRTLSRKRRNH